MQVSNQKKLCWNCEGSVHPEAIFCPYCGYDLAFNENPEKNYAHSVENELSQTLYKPPYLKNSTTNFAIPSERPSEKNESVVNESDSIGLWPLLFLSIGSNLLVLGLILFFFAEKGKVALEWNAYHWFLYCTFSVPFLIIGWKLLKRIPKE